MQEAAMDRDEWILAQAYAVRHRAIALERRSRAHLPGRPWATVRAGEAEFRVACFSHAPRYKVAAWRQGCCDEAAPLGACPKQILVAVSVCTVAWPPRLEVRGAGIDAAAQAWRGSQA